MTLAAFPLAIVAVFVIATSMLDRTNGRLRSGGVERRYLLYVPPSYDHTRATPLVISLHGAAAWPAQQMHMTHWNELAAASGFIVVYPAALGRVWRVSHPGSDPSGDARFIRDLIDTLEHRYNIDTTRIYANGFSLGGGMAFALSCLLPQRVAALGTVSAAQALSWQWCGDHRPIPLVNFHGSADLVPYNGGLSPDPFNPVMFPPVRVWTATWARRNGCTPSPRDSTITREVMVTQYRGCSNDAAVVLYTVRGGGHAWPGGKALPRWLFGRTTTDVDATRVMWAFFQAHPQLPPNRRLERTRP